MSTKTLRKRIALATVAALGAGVFSLVSVPVANAAISATSFVATNGVTGAIIDDTDTGITHNASSGMLSAISGSGTTQTATMLAGGKLAAEIDVASGISVVTVTGGTIASVKASDYLSSDLTLAGANNDFALLATPSAGATSMTVKVYTGATANNSTAGGTLSKQIVVTVASTSTSGVYSAAKSKVNMAVASDATADGVDQNNATTGSPSVIPNSASGYINVDLYDAYGVSLADDSVVVSATNGALVGINGTLGSSTAGTRSTAVATDHNFTVTVSQGTANVGVTTTVTISYAGTVVGTKSITFQGEVAKVTVSNVQVARAGAYTASGGVGGNAAFRVRYYDAAGSQLWPSDATSATTSVSGTTNAFVSAYAVDAAGDSSTGTAAYGKVNCGGTVITGKDAGSNSAMQLQYVNASGSVVKSNVWTQVCGGDADTYTAKFDKSVYKPGEIATLTITFKDAMGKLTHTLKNNIATDGGTDKIVISGAPATSAVTDPTQTDRAGVSGVNADSTISYQYVVGTTEGSFQAIVSVPLVNTAMDGEKQTVSYSVSSGSTSLNDVLKGIVDLIASINKQIAALAKLVTKKK